jgi:hypothetical protein
MEIGEETCEKRKKKTKNDTPLFSCYFRVKAISHFVENDVLYVVSISSDGSVKVWNFANIRKPQMIAEVFHRVKSVRALTKLSPTLTLCSAFHCITKKR